MVPHTLWDYCMNCHYLNLGIKQIWTVRDSCTSYFYIMSQHICPFQIGAHHTGHNLWYYDDMHIIPSEVWQITETGGRVKSRIDNVKICYGKVRSKDVKLGPTEAKPEMSNYLDDSGVSWGLRWQRIRLQCRRPEFDSWVEKIPWRMECLHTPVFLPEEFHGQGIWRATVHGVAKSQTWLSN